MQMRPCRSVVRQVSLCIRRFGLGRPTTAETTTTTLDKRLSHQIFACIVAPRRVDVVVACVGRPMVHALYHCLRALLNVFLAGVKAPLARSYVLECKQVN